MFELGENRVNMEPMRLGSQISQSTSKVITDVIEKPWTCQWNDITESFLHNASGLPLGTLVHSSNFTLFEAMSAIELMDPKMDAGLVRQTKPVDFNAAVTHLQNGSLKVDDIGVDEVVGVIDGSWACLVMWLEGHAAVQTVFTNLYLHDINAIQDDIMRPFAFGMLKLINIIKIAITSAAVFEEEDFQVSMHDFDVPLSCSWFLDNPSSWFKVEAMLKSAQDKLKKEKAEDETVVQAGLARIMFLRQFCQAVVAIVFPESNSNSQKLPISNNQLSEVEKLLQSCKQLLDKQIIPTCSQSPNLDPTFGGLSAFEPNVNQKLLPPTFPRRPQLVTVCDAYKYIQALVDRCIAICRLLPNNSLSISSTLDMFRDFSRKTSCVLSRSLIQLAYGVPLYMNELSAGTASLESVRHSMRQFMQIAEKSPAPDDKLENVFVHETCKVLFNLLQLCGNNRARQREKLIHCFEDFAYLQEQIDQNGEFSVICRYHAYITYHVLKLMHDYLQLGFELNLYAPYEYAYVFWYQNEIVYRLLTNILNKAADSSYKMEQVKNSKGDKKKQQKSKKKPDHQLHRMEALHWQSYQKISHAYFLMMVGLHQLDKVQVPVSSDGLWERATRFQHRMSAFSSLTTPPPIDYRQFIEMSRFDDIRRHLKPSQVLAEAAETFEEMCTNLAKTCLDDPNDVLSLSQVCKHNALALRLLANGHTRQRYTDFDFTKNKYYPTIKL